MKQSQNFDQYRQKDIPEGTAVNISKVKSIDPLAYYVGQVTRTVSDNPDKSKIMDLSPFIDRQNKTIKSATGELVWDYGNGLLKVNASSAQGVTGFINKAGLISCADIKIKSAIEYGSIIAVSLDRKSLRSSGKILVQVMTEDQNYGWETKMTDVPQKKGPAIPMKEITSLGEPPICVKNIEGILTLKRSDASSLKVTALDLNGYAKKELPAGTGDIVKIDFLPDCLYYIISK